MLLTRKMRIYSLNYCKSSSQFLHNLPKDFLLESLENIAQNNLIEAFSSNVDGGNANYFATVLILSNLTIEEILNRVENLDLELVTIFESFLDAIVQIKPTVENHYKYQKLSFKLLDKTDDTRYQTIAQMLICLKFDHQFFNLLDYEKMLKEFGQFLVKPGGTISFSFHSNAPL